MSAFYAAISMAISATTDRKGAATATIIGLMIGSLAITNAVVDGGDQSELWRLGDLASLPFELTSRIHGEEGEWASRDISTGLIWLVAVGIIAACAVWIWDRYRRMLVRR